MRKAISATLTFLAVILFYLWYLTRKGTYARLH